MKNVLLGDIAKVSSGGTPDRAKPAYWGGQIPWIKTGEIQFGIIRDAEEKITELALNESSTKVVPEGSLLMAMYGQGKTRGQVALLGIEAAINQACAAISPYDPDDSRYLFQFLAANYGNVRRLSNSGGQENLNAELIRGIRLYFPAKSERQKIADILGTWDEALEKLDTLIAAKARRKQALMQQLLAVAAQKVGHGHARHRLGEVVERVTRKNTVGNDNVLTISAQDGLINQREYFNRSVAGADLSGYFLLRGGEFAYNRSSSIGFPYGAIKRLDRYDAGVVSTLYLCFRIRDTAKVSSDYLAHYLDGGFLNAGLRSVAKEGARAHGLLNITADEFMDIDIFLPPLALQTKIAAVFDSADSELRLLRQQRTTLGRQKRGLMQQLLTGKVRVAP